MMMDICDSGHEEIAFNSRTCPMCDLLKLHEDALNDAGEEIRSLKQDLETLEANYAELDSLIADPLISAIAQKRKEEHDKQQS